MKAIDPHIRKPQGISRRSDSRQHNQWLVASMASFNARSASRSIQRGANRITKWILRCTLASTAAAAIGLGCLLMTDSGPDASATTTPAQATGIAVSGAANYSGSKDPGK